MYGKNGKNGDPSVRARRELAIATIMWPQLSVSQKQQLNSFLSLGFSVSSGDFQLVDEKWYVTHSGLLRLARRNRCHGIQTETVSEFCDPTMSRWVVKAIVFKTPRSKGFVGYGDADPSNVSPVVRGAELRIAETRAVSRALRKAYGIGTCSIEELGANVKPQGGGDNAEPTRNRNGEPRLRDRLLILVRKFRLDSEQLKHYAAHFCGTTALRHANREQVQQLVEHLDGLAAEGRDRLIAELATAGEAPRKADPMQQNLAEQNKEAA